MKTKPETKEKEEKVSSKVTVPFSDLNEKEWNKLKDYIENK